MIAETPNVARHIANSLKLFIKTIVREKNPGLAHLLYSSFTVPKGKYKHRPENLNVETLKKIFNTIEHQGGVSARQSICHILYYFRFFLEYFMELCSSLYIKLYKPSIYSLCISSISFNISFPLSLIFIIKLDKFKIKSIIYFCASFLEVIGEYSPALS
ncbi:hypothetical protein [Acidianus manzaensis]|uniref:hypothetical protein n=1 Tax=Acidianus manzaensis TaxID=282676 RepID=UPI001F2EE464|nr:hypothetical protein [Acidianus manzaensis]